MKKIKNKTFLKYKFLSSLKANEDNTLAGLIVTEIKKRSNRYLKNLFLFNGEHLELFKKDVGSFCFDGNTVVILDKEGVYSKIDLITKEVVDTFKLNIAGDIVSLGNGRYLISAESDLYHPDLHCYSKKQLSNYQEELKENEAYQVMDEYPFYFNGAGYINKKRNSLYVYDHNTKITERINTITIDVEGYDLCGNEIMYYGVDYDAVKGKTSRVYVYNFTKKNETVIYDKEDLMVHRIFYKDNKHYVAGTKGLRYGFMENPIFYEIKNGDLVEYLDFDTTLYNSVLSDCRYGAGNSYLNYNGEPYFLVPKGQKTAVYKLGKKMEVIHKNHESIDGFTFVNGKLVTFGFYDSKLQEIYYHLEDEVVQVSEFNEHIKKDYYVAEPIKHSIAVANTTVDGFVLLPYNYDETKKYPMILNIHGGPKMAYGDLFFNEMQIWASMGYIVAYCNPRGSDGKGNEFMDLRKGIASIAYQDLMQFTDSVIETYAAVDTTRLVVAGGSYGGYMTNYIIGQTNRFNCAISQRSISNWISMTTASDYGIDHPIEMEYEDIYNANEEMWDASPLKYANNAKTPTLFIHAFEDYRCPLFEALQMYTVLKCNGVDTRLVAFKNENHDLSRTGKPKARIRRLEEMGAWLEKYNGKEEEV